MDYHCSYCNYTTTLKSHYNRHLKSKKHSNRLAGNTKDTYECIHCDYTTLIKNSYDKHVKGIKHLERIAGVTTDID